MPAEGVRTVRSFCRICTSVCGILVEVDGDVVTRVRGDREHPLSQGYTCPKGRALPQMHHHPDRIERPQMRIDGQLRDIAYQATTTDFWNSMEAVGGPQTYVLGGAFNCGKGQPGQVAPVSHGAPTALFRQVRVLNTAEEGK